MWRLRTTGNDLPTATPASQSLPNPEVSERPKRRRFPAAYKLRIVQEADAAAPVWPDVWHSCAAGIFLRRALAVLAGFLGIAAGSGQHGTALG
jgi:hypothetical protein